MKEAKLNICTPQQSVHFLQLQDRNNKSAPLFITAIRPSLQLKHFIYEGWNFNSGNYLFTTDTK